MKYVVFAELDGVKYRALVHAASRQEAIGLARFWYGDEASVIPDRRIYGPQLRLWPESLK